MGSSKHIQFRIGEESSQSEMFGLWCVCGYGCGLDRYDFVPPVKYKYLNDEEAEAQFERRNKTLNFFSVMVSKRIREKEGELDSGLRGSTAGKVSCLLF